MVDPKDFKAIKSDLEKMIVIGKRMMPMTVKYARLEEACSPEQRAELEPLIREMESMGKVLPR